MKARNYTLPAVMLLLLALVALPGCSTAGKELDSSMSLMDRFKTGKSLMGPDEDESKLTPVQHVKRGDSYLNGKHSELAFDQYSKAALKDPNFTEARYKKGNMLFQKGMYGEAMSEFTAVLDLDPNHAPTHEAVGRIYFDNRLYSEARKHLTEAVSLDGERVKSVVLLGATLNHMNEFEAAAAHFARAAKLSPQSGYIYNNLGLALVRLDRKEEAVDAFSKALMLGAPADKTCNNLGITLFRLGREEEALEAFKCAGDEAAAYNNLGYAYFLDKRYREAARCFEKAIELRPMFYVRADENLKRARLAAEFKRNVPDNQQPDQPRSKAIPAAASDSDRPEISKAVATEENSRPEIKKVMKIYSDSPAPLAVKNPDQPVFAVHASSWRTGDKAHRQAEFLNKLGLEARVVQVEVEGKGVWHRVVVGAYSEYDKAVEALESVSEMTGIKEMRVIRCTVPENCNTANI